MNNLAPLITHKELAATNTEANSPPMVVRVTLPVRCTRCMLIRQLYQELELPDDRARSLAERSHRLRTWLGAGGMAVVIVDEHHQLTVTHRDTEAGPSRHQHALRDLLKDLSNAVSVSISVRSRLDGMTFETISLRDARRYWAAS